MDVIEVPDFKVVFVGAICVGKSSLVQRFVKGEFQENLQQTTGAAFSRATVEVAERGPVKLQLWDTAGQEKYRALVRIYYRGSAGAIVTFDQSEPSSFEYARSWVINLRQEDPTMSIVLAANKCDLNDPRALMKTVNKYAKHENLKVMLTSAKTGEGVAALFEEVADQVSRRHNRLLREDESAGIGEATTRGSRNQRDSVFGRDLTAEAPATPGLAGSNKTAPKTSGGCGC